MIDAWLEPLCEPPEPTVYCPECDEEAEINNDFQIECYSCEKCFEIPEPSFLEDNDEGYAYGY